MKRSKQCPKCSSLKVGYLPNQPDVGDRGPSTRPVGVEVGFDVFGFFGRESYVGNLEAYVCTECGYHESYVVAPAALEWSKITDLVMLNPSPPDDHGPYR